MATSKLIFKNNSQSTVANIVGQSAGATALVVADGSKFAQPTAGTNYFVGTFIDKDSGLINEIVHVTARTGNNMTIERAQEGTALQAWEVGDTFAELWTAGQAAAMVQQVDIQAQPSGFTSDIGSANAYNCIYTPPLTVHTLGQPLRFKALNTNTGPSVINVGPGSVPLLSAQGLALFGGEIVAAQVYEIYYMGSAYNLAQPRIVTFPAGMVAPYAGITAPTGWLVCNGALVTVAAYPTLYNAILDAYNTGGETIGTNFRVPDLRGRVVAGLDAGQGRLSTTYFGGTNNTRGGVGGSDWEQAGVPIAGHTVGGGQGFGYGSVSGHVAGSIKVAGDTAQYTGLEGTTPGGSNSSAPNHSHSVDINVSITRDGAAGYNLLHLYEGAFSGQISPGAAATTDAVQNIQPTMVMSYIIKT